MYSDNFTKYYIYYSLRKLFKNTIYFYYFSFKLKPLLVATDQ